MSYVIQTACFGGIHSYVLSNTMAKYREGTRIQRFFRSGSYNENNVNRNNFKLESMKSQVIQNKYYINKIK